MSRLFDKLPLWLKIYWLVFLLFFAVILSICFTIVSWSNKQALSQAFAAALDEHAAIAGGLTAISGPLYDELRNEPDLEYVLLSRFAESVVQSSAERKTRVRLSNSEGAILYSNFSPELAANIGLMPHPDGRRSYVARNLDGARHIFVSGHVRLGHFLFRLDYAADATGLAESQFALATRISFLVSGSMLLLAAGLFFLVKKTMSPVAELNEQAKAIAEGDYGRRATVGALDEIGQLAMSFNRMAEAVESHVGMLKAGIAERERFMASLSHEIKTPLTSILGNVSLLKNYDLDKAGQEQAIRTIGEAGKRLDGMAKKLLHLFRISEGRGIHREAKGVEELFQQLEKITNPSLVEKKQGLLMDASLEHVVVDEELWLLLLSNLVDNASKASRPGSTIRLDVFAEGDEAVFIVGDDGCGIPEEEIGKVFEPFYMSGYSGNKQPGGYGLGLPLCRTIAEAHGGSIAIDSKPGRGTKVSVRIPVDSGTENFAKR